MAYSHRIRAVCDIHTSTVSFSHPYQGQTVPFPKRHAEYALCPLFSAISISSLHYTPFTTGPSLLSTQSFTPPFQSLILPPLIPTTTTLTSSSSI